MRLIDADYLIEKICGKCKQNCGYCFDALMIYRIKQEPTIDAVPVVRCRDCKYFNNDVSNNEYCKLSLCQVNADDYCRDGERKEYANKI